MVDHIRILLIEDVEDDALLFVEELRRAGLNFSWRRVDSALETDEATVNEHWDCVVSDFSLPGFNALEALEIVRTHDLNVPFVVLSGSIGEETAAEIIRRGAQDCLMKDRPHRWAEVVRREVDAARRRIENEEATHALQEMQRHYHATFDFGPLAIVHIAPDGELLRANRRFLSMLGYELDEIRSLGLLEITHPDDRHDTADSVLQLVTGDVDPLISQKRYLRRDGTPVWAEVHSTLVRDQLDRPQYVLSFINDISERIHAESALHESDKRYRSLVEVARDIIVSIDVDGNLTMVNEAGVRASGWKREELSGAHFMSFVHPEDRGHAEFVLQRVIETGEFATTELRTRTAEGTWLPLEATASPEFHEGRIQGIVVVARDLSERRQAEEEKAKMKAQLELADRLAALGRVSAGIAHEFNNVLMGISPFADVIAQRAEAPELARASRQIQTSIARGRRITNEILRFTRPAPPATRELNVHEWLPDLEEELRGLLNDSVQLTIEQTGNPLVLRADREQIDQVLLNLAANARDAMNGTGAISVRISHGEYDGSSGEFGSVPAKSMVHISVRDNGPGIPEEHRARLFEPFFTTKRNGTGLGLPIAFELVRQNDGLLFVESEVGVGTTFHIFLKGREGRVTENHELDGSRTGSASLRKILIVEDDEPVAEGLMTLLEIEGIETKWVSEGRAAERAVKEFGPDLVLLDVGLPDISGIEVCRLIRSSWPDLPIVFSTGHGEYSDKSRAGDAAPTLRKPYGIDDLYQVWESFADTPRPA